MADGKLQSDMRIQRPDVGSGMVKHREGLQGSLMKLLKGQFLKACGSYTHAIFPSASIRHIFGLETAAIT
jgi:hypothetical protein